VTVGLRQEVFHGAVVGAVVDAKERTRADAAMMGEKMGESSPLVLGAEEDGHGPWNHADGVVIHPLEGNGAHGFSAPLG